MSPIPFLSELVVLAGSGVLVAVLLRLLRIPVITVLLVAGAVVGPHGIGIVKDAHNIEVLAEVGVVLLLFTIGLEFSRARLLRIGRLVMVGGLLQVALTVGGVVVLAAVLGEPASRGVFFGFLAALSSTAIVLRALTERGEVESPHGRLIVGALIFQDLCVVPMMLVVPVLAGVGGDNTVAGAALALGKAALIVGATVAIARVALPRFFALVDRARSREIFLLSVLVICIGTAWLTSLAGLSLALGAFLAGMLLADSDYAHRAMTDVLPLRDVLTSLFFMSLGMLFDARVFVEEPLAVGLIFAGLLAGKSAIAALAAITMRFPPRVAVLVGVGLAQFSEFGFVLAQVGGNVGLITPAEMRILLASAILTMLVTPILIKLGPHLAAGATRLKLLARVAVGEGLDAPEDARLAGHVIVVGYGIAGRVLAGALRDSSVQFVVLDLNGDAVREARAAGELAFYGDAANPEVLARAGIAKARALVLLINDPYAAERAIAAARFQAPGTPIFVRAHYLTDAARLTSLGATDAVIEEVEAGIEMLARTLRHVGIPRNVLVERVGDAREKTQRSARALTVPRHRLGALAELDLLKVESFLVRDGAFAVNRSPVEMGVRSRTGALVVAIHRDGALIEQADPSQPIRAGDVLYLVGSRPALARALAFLESGRLE